MTRRLPTYSDERLASVVAETRRNNPGTHDELIADLAAMGLAGFQADDDALDDAARQAMEWMTWNGGR